VVFKSTRNVEYLHLSSREALCLWIGHVISSENGETQKNQDLFKKLLKNGAYARLLSIKNSHSSSNIQVQWKPLRFSCFMDAGTLLVFLNIFSSPTSVFMCYIK
jgi:hypothetical protein